jgi:hypothetical protein
MSLSDWFNNGWLKTHRTSREEIRNLLNLIRRDLNDCQVPDLSSDWRFAIAYNAALQCCAVALYCHGYKPARGQSEHYRVIQSLVYTLGQKYADDRDYLNACRNKRNISDYDAAGTISRNETDELTVFANELYEKLLDWLQKNYPDYY